MHPIPARTIPFCAATGIACLVAGISPLTAVAQSTPPPLEPYGTILVQGNTWAGASAALGNLDVYSNGTGSTHSLSGSYGLEYQCVELAQRWAATRFGEQAYWPVAYAYQMWAVAPKLKVPFDQLANGATTAPQFGDILIFNRSTDNPYGHVAVIASVDIASAGQTGYVDIVEQNAYANNAETDAMGTDQIPITTSVTANSAGDYTYTMPETYGMPILGWLRSSTAPLGLQGAGGPGGYTLSDYGFVNPYGSAPPVAQTTSWSWDIAVDIAVTPNGTSGYVLDGFGGIHAFGGAPPVQVTGYWNGWDIARTIILLPDGHSGYVLDGWGGLHPFGTAGDIPPLPQVTGYWVGRDVVVGAVVDSAGTGGFTLDAYGGVHPWGLSGDVPALPAITGYWSGWRIATGITLIPGTLQGYVLDGYNGIHPFGGAPAPSSAPYYAGQDIAGGIVATGPGSGYTVLANGNVEAFGQTFPVTVPSVSLPKGAKDIALA